MTNEETDDIALAVQQFKRARKMEVLVMERRVLELLPPDYELREQVISLFLNRLNELTQDIEEPF